MLDVSIVILNEAFRFPLAINVLQSLQSFIYILSPRINSMSYCLTFSSDMSNSILTCCHWPSGINIGIGS